MVIIHIVLLVYQRVTMGIHCFGIPLRDSPQFPFVSGLPLAVLPQAQQQKTLRDELWCLWLAVAHTKRSSFWCSYVAIASGKVRVGPWFYNHVFSCKINLPTPFSGRVVMLIFWTLKPGNGKCSFQWAVKASQGCQEIEEFPHVKTHVHLWHLLTMSTSSTLGFRAA